MSAETINSPKRFKEEAEKQEENKDRMM